MGAAEEVVGEGGGDAGRIGGGGQAAGVVVGVGEGADDGVGGIQPVFGGLAVEGRMKGTQLVLKQANPDAIPWSCVGPQEYG
jgi:hypothetical protein